MLLGKPLIAVNHINGHIASNYITYKDLEPPFLCLIISGGHTYLVKVKDYNKSEILGKTRDDAIGEAFDKVARVVNLGYPGGPKIDNLAKSGKENIDLPVTHLDNLDFSFSGIKTAVINLNHKKPNINKADLCFSFQKSVTEMLLNNVKKVLKNERENKIVLAGGVSRNSYIRKAFDDFSKDENITVYYPEDVLCTDNAAMIASARILSIFKEGFCRLKFECSSKFKIIIFFISFIMIINLVINLVINLIINLIINFNY